MRVTHIIVALVSLIALAAPGVSSIVFAFGPGVHSREAQEVLRRLAETQPEYATLAANPAARNWLTLGSISPDFMFMADSLGFGHEPGLSHHLIAAAEELGPEYRLFALGHLCHVASDGSSEAFVVPALFSSAAIGPTDLFVDQPAYKEAEGVVESLGDLLTGDWHAVVDLLYDLWMPPADRSRFDAVFAWYCEEGRTFLGRDVDCEAARAELAGPLGTLEEALSLFDRQGAHGFIDHLTSLPIEDLMDFALSAAGGDTFGGFIGAGLGTGLTDHVDDEIAYLRTTAFVESAFWAGYEGLAGLGPAFALDRLADKTSGWPSYDIPGIESGLLASALRYLGLQVTPGFMVDELVFRGPGGEVLDEVTPALAGQTLTATLRFYSAWPLTATLTGRVLKDVAGLEGPDLVVGESIVEVDIDPHTYARTPRGTLTIPFVADLEGALLFQVELAVDGVTTLTTSRDKLWLVDKLDPSSSRFRELILMSPRALPVQGASSNVGLVVVEVEVGSPTLPSGVPLPQAIVNLGHHFEDTSIHGLAVLGEVFSGRHPLIVRHPDHHEVRLDVDVQAVASAVDLDAVTRVQVALEPVLRLSAGDGRFSISKTDLALQVDTRPFAGLARGFEVSVRGTRPLGNLVLDSSGTGSLVLTEAVTDGTRLEVTGRADFGGEFGREARTEVVVDTTPPTLSSSVTPLPGPSCTDTGGVYRPANEVLLILAEPHSGLTEVLMREGEGEWKPLEVTGGEVIFESPEGTGATSVTVRAANGASLDTTTVIELPEVILPACGAKDEPEAESADTAEAEPKVAQEEGCGAAFSGLPALMVLAVFSVRSKRQRVTA